MNIRDFYEFIADVDVFLKEKYQVKDEETLAYGRLAKLSEEMGELSAEVLKHYGKQHETKLKNVTKEELENEFADVIITTVLLAKVMDVDISKATENKIEKIKVKLGL